MITIYIHISFQEVYSFSSYVEVFGPFWVNSCVRCEEGIHLVPLHMLVSHRFVEKIILSALNELGTLVKNERTSV